MTDKFIPFNPETAKNGDKICFSNCDYVYTYVGPYPKQGYDGSVLMDQNSNLTFASNKFLYIPKTKRTVWINVYTDNAAYKYDTAYEAAARKLPGKDFIGTYPLEIEE